jgi:hypothetical protein
LLGLVCLRSLAERECFQSPPSLSRLQFLGPTGSLLQGRPPATSSATSSASSSKKSAKKAAKSAKKQAKQSQRSQSPAVADDEAVLAQILKSTNSFHGTMGQPDWEELERWMHCGASARFVLREAALTWAAMVFASACTHEAMMAALLDGWHLLDLLEVGI